MWKSNQPGSELNDTSSDPFTARTGVSGRENTGETLDTQSSRPLRMTPVRPCSAAKESRISYLSAEKKSNLRYLKKTDDQCFSPVETTMESYQSDAVKSSSDKEFNSFDGNSSRPGPSQKRQIYRMKAQDAEPYPTASDIMSPLPRDEKNMCGEKFDRKRKNAPSRSNQSSYQLNHGYSPEQACSYSPSTNIQRANLHHQLQAQGSNETYPSCQTISSSLNLQRNTKREETGPPIRRNASSESAVTTLPPIQQRITKQQGNTQHRLRQSQLQVPLEQRGSAVLSRVRRYGRQEVCEGRNTEYRMSRRQGVCKETDNTQEQRTFVRVLGNVFEGENRLYKLHVTAKPKLLLFVESIN